MHRNQPNFNSAYHLSLLHEKTRATRFVPSFYRKFVSIMDFHTNFSPSLALPDISKTSESDFESIDSTIPTKNQTKRSTNTSVRPFTDNARFHLVTSSNTKPKIKSVTTATPHPLQYPQSQYDYSSKVPKTKKKLIQTIFNFLVKKCTEKQPKKTKNEPEDDEIVPIPPGLFDINPFPTTLLENITRNCDK